MRIICNKWFWNECPNKPKHPDGGPQEEPRAIPRLEPRFRRWNGNRKAQDERNHCLGSGYPSIPPCHHTAECRGALSAPGHLGASDNVHRARVTRHCKPWQELALRQGMGHKMVSLPAQSWDRVGGRIGLCINGFCPWHCLLSEIMWDSDRHLPTFSTQWLTHRRNTGWAPMVYHVLCQMLRPQELEDVSPALTPFTVIVGTQTSQRCNTKWFILCPR